MSAPRMVDLLTPERQQQFRAWWAQESRRGHWMRAGLNHLLPEYLTSEQCADVAEYGGFAFVTERGDVKYTLLIGHYAGRCLRPASALAEGIAWMLAVKLVWQADQAGVERVMGNEGYHLP